MSKRNELTLNDLLTWEDLISLGDPRGESDYFLSKKVFRECCLEKEDRRKYEANFKTYIYDKFFEKFPDSLFPIEKLDIRLMFAKNDDGTWKITYSIPHLFNSFYSYVMDGILIEEDSDIEDKTMLALLLASDSEGGLKNAVKEMVTHVDTQCRTYIREMNDKMHRRPEIAMTIQNLIDKMLVSKRILRSVTKNFDEIYEFFTGSYPIEVLETVNKDKLMLNMVAAICTNSTINKVLSGTYDLETFIKYIDRADIICALNYANNYRLMIEYLNNENNNEYFVEMKIKTKTGSASLTSKEVIDSFEEINKPLRENPELNKKIGFYHSYQEFLENKVKEAWNRMKNKKIITKIKVKFNMLLSGTFNLDKNKYGGKPRTEKGQAELKKQYDLMHAKIEYYESKKPVVELVGIDNFVGYFAQFYENGCVVLDKLCRYSKNKKGEEVILPSKNDAIYIMNHKEFANFCTYTKPELIEEKSKSNPNIDRKNHSDGWQRRVDEIIAGPGYGGIDLDFLNRLVEELAIEEYNSEEVIKKLEK